MPETQATISTAAGMLVRYRRDSRLNGLNNDTSGVVLGFVVLVLSCILKLLQ